MSLYLILKITVKELEKKAVAFLLKAYLLSSAQLANKQGDYCGSCQ